MGENTTLPFLPGYSFSDPNKTNSPVDQTLKRDRGCDIPKVLQPDTPRRALELCDAQNHILDDKLIELTYGPRRTFQQKRVVPHFVSYDKKVLRFYGYFREDVNGCWGEKFRVHCVKVCYYLENDTFEVCEPKVQNSGLLQGLVLKRQKLPHPNGQDMYHWKDLNIGADLVVYGKNIHLTDCDEWTKEFLRSNGITVITKAEDLPLDSYSEKLKERERQQLFTTPNIEDNKLWKFLNKDRQVLRFYAMWDDTITEPYESRKVIILYYLVDDTMEVLEVIVKNSGRDPVQGLIKRQRIPVNLESVPEKFPSCYLEFSDKEVENWFTPSELGIGKTIIVFGRKFFIYDCDDFTRQYYKNSLGVILPEAIEIKPEPKKIYQRDIPPYQGFGTWEDSIQSCIYTHPKLLKKDESKMLHHNDKFLRFSAHMDTCSPIDCSRKFILTFFPADDTVKIHELTIPNSGIPSGAFMKRCRLLKKYDPESNCPIYYEVSDFYIGATFNASGRKFVIDDADKYVLTFMEGNPHIYNEKIIQVHRDKTVGARLAKEPLCSRRISLEDKMRQYVVQACGEEPLPITIDLGEDEQPFEIVKNKLLASNIPIPKECLDEAMKLCMADNGKVDATELNKLISSAFGQQQKATTNSK